MNFFLTMILPEILALLQHTVKNPQSIAAEKAILIQVRDTINQILAGLGS